MIDLEQILYDRVKQIMSGWDVEDIYAVSFFAYSNEEYEYRGFSNVTNFAVSYNTESESDGAGPRSEQRWNYAFWPQLETPVIDCNEPTPETDILFDWYAQQGIEDPGFEDEDSNGPTGFTALMDVLSKVARRLQEEGFLKEKFGRPIPILVHELEYWDYIMELTAYANPHGEADDFLSDWDDEDFSPEETGSDGDFEEFRAIIGSVASKINDKAFMDQLLGIKKDVSDDEDVEKLRKLIFE